MKIAPKPEELATWRLKKMEAETTFRVTNGELSMKLTDGERLIVVMLAEVMEALKLNRELDTTLVKSLVINNDGWALRRKYSGLFESEAPSDDVVKEKTDILWMFGIIESSMGRLTGSDAEEARGWHYNQWHGFDGNNDPHYGVARTMIE